MKQNFEEPKLEITEIAAADIIATSTIRVENFLEDTFNDGFGDQF